MHCIFPVFIVFSSYRTFLLPGYNFPIASFGQGPGDCGQVLQGFFCWFSLSMPYIFHVPITLGAINTN